MRQKPSSEKPPSVTRQWIWGFHSRGRPKVWRTQIKPGTKFLDMFNLKNIRRTTLRTAWNKQSRRERSSRKKWRRSSSIVKTQWRWEHWMSWKAMELALSWQYLMPQVGQNLLLQRKGTNLRLLHLGQEYIAPPKAGSPQLIIFVTLSMTTWRGCKMYTISS